LHAADRFLAIGGLRDPEAAQFPLRDAQQTTA
jgi:hypothetical protein